MSTQQALFVSAAGADGEWAIKDILIPSPAKGEIMILGSWDWLRPAFGYLIEKFPVIMGGAIAGTIEAVGEGVTDFAKGERIITALNAGGFQQYIVIPAAVAIRLPENINFDSGSTVPVTCPTACVGLFAPKPIGLGLNPTFSWEKPQKGQSALVTGAGTSVGQYAVQLLKFLGFERIVVYASEAHFNFLKGIGATHCIDRNSVAVANLSLSPAIAGGVDVAYVVHGDVNEVYDSVVDGGKIATSNPRAVLAREGRSIDFCPHLGYYYGPDIWGMSPSAVGYAATLEHSAFGRLIIKNLPKMLETKVITPNRVEVLPNGIKGIKGGLERLENQSVSGKKLVSHPNNA